MVEQKRLRSCDDCKFLLLTDEGYSNWTVENTIARCLLSANPRFPADHAWGMADDLNHAEQCASFEAGDPIHLDVDRDKGDAVNYTDDDIVKAILILEGFASDKY